MEATTVPKETKIKSNRKKGQTNPHSLTKFFSFFSPFAKILQFPPFFPSKFPPKSGYFGSFTPSKTKKIIIFLSDNEDDTKKIFFLRGKMKFVLKKYVPLQFKVFAI